MGKMKHKLAEVENAVAVSAPALQVQQMPAPDDDGWADAAHELEGRLFRGTKLQFADGQWTTGKEKNLVEKGKQLLALSTALAWLKWEDKKLTKVLARQRGQQLPERDELGDVDRDQWEMGLGNELRDPWQLTRFLYLVDIDTAEAFTFSSAAFSAHSAVTQLSDQITRMRVAQPNASPIVELGWAPYPTQYGMKSKPHFKVVGWRGSTVEEEEQEGPLTMPSPKSELDDDIPF